MSQWFIHTNGVRGLIRESSRQVHTLTLNHSRETNNKAAIAHDSWQDYMNRPSDAVTGAAHNPSTYSTY
jgi:hypothetical protein